MLLTPSLVALLAAGADIWGLLALLGWFTAYSLRGPLEVLVGQGASGRAGMAHAEESVARFWLLLFALAAALLLLSAAARQPRLLALLAIAGLLLGIVWWRALRGETRSLASGLLAVVGLMAGAPLYYMAATGSVGADGWAVTLASLAFFGGSVFRVKSVGRERRSAGFRWFSAALHFGFVALAGLAALAGWAPALLPLALTPPFLWAVYGAWRGGRSTASNLGSVGWAEIYLTLLFALLLIISVRI